MFYFVIILIGRYCFHCTVLLCTLLSSSVSNVLLTLIQSHVLWSLLVNIIVVYEKRVNRSMKFYAGPKITNCGQFGYFLNDHRNSSCLCNKHFFILRHYIKHACIHSEVNANVLNRHIFLLCHFMSVSPNILYDNGK